MDIWELLPETWQLESENPCCHSKRPRRSLVTDIGLWTECYATMAAILDAAYPSKAPHFFTYLRTITKASRNFEGSAWASYDMAFRRQAANRGSLDWGCVDPALYNEAFAGRAKLVPQCRYCLADSHASQECPPQRTHLRLLRRRAARPAHSFAHMHCLADQRGQWISAVSTTLRECRDAASRYVATPTNALGAAVLIRWQSATRGLASSSRARFTPGDIPHLRLGPAARHRPPSIQLVWRSVQEHQTS